MRLREPGRQTIEIQPLVVDENGDPQFVQNFGGRQYAVRLMTRTNYDNTSGQVASVDENIAVAVDAGGNLVYNGNALLIDESDVRTTSYTYDDFGRRIRVTYADDSFMLTHYDESGRVIGESQQLAAATDAEWSADDNSFIVTGSNPVVLIPTKSFEYDANRRLTAVVLPEVHDPIADEMARPRYEYGYDAEGKQVLIRDPLGRETRFEYVDGRQVRRTLPLGFGDDGIAGTADDPTVGTFVEEFGYDLLGRQEWHRSFEGRVTSFHYDDAAGAGEQEQPSWSPRAMLASQQGKHAEQIARPTLLARRMHGIYSIRRIAS